MAVVIRIPTPLRKFTDGRAEVEAEGATLREVFEHVDRQYAGLHEKIFDDSGDIRRFINVFVNGEDVRHGEGVSTIVKAGDEVSVVPAIAGGAPSCGRRAPASFEGAPGRGRCTRTARA